MKCVVIGFGALGRHIVPCYRRLLGDGLASGLVAIKGTDKDLAALNARYPFPVQAGGAAEALRRMRPDVVVLAVRPTQLKAQLEGVLRPYLDELRAQGAALPDIYSFVADPPADRYGPLLGPGVNVACMIPNMRQTVGGYETAPIGTPFMALDPSHPWPEANLARVRDFLGVTGCVLQVAPEEVAVFISLDCSCHVMYEFNFNLLEALAARGTEATLSRTAQTFRQAFRPVFSDPATGIVPCGGGFEAAEIRRAAAETQRAWYEGVMDYARETGMDLAVAARHVGGSIELFHIEAQLGTRESLEASTRLHATPGGFTEKAIRTYMEAGDGLCREAIAALLDGREAGPALAALRAQAARCVRETVDHGRTLGRSND